MSSIERPELEGIFEIADDLSQKSGLENTERRQIQGVDNRPELSGVLEDVIRIGESRTRNYVSWLFLAFVAIVTLLFSLYPYFSNYFPNIKYEDVKDMATLVLPPIFSMLSAVLAYYFTSKNNSK